MKSDFILKTATKNEAPNYKTSKKKRTFSCIIITCQGNQLPVTKLAGLEEVVLVGDRIGQKDDVPLSNVLRILASLYITPCLEPDGH